MCGERVFEADEDLSTNGSSPRVRGTQQRILGQPYVGRFIPACAGNAQASTGQSLRQTVHPRVCGERDVSNFSNPSGNGSSPRVRGTRHRGGRRPRPLRFIPACAGNAKARVVGVVHFCGSSPRVRGTPRPPPNRRLWPPVHPRVCGERVIDVAELPAGPGSSPRVRGTPGPDQRGPDLNRFIPACAGNAAKSTTTPPSRAVHPRVCGERSTRSFCSRKLNGSSPRVRGTREALARQPPVSPVHPRVCGERWRNGRLAASMGGSSPRVRGTRAPATAGRGGARFIPACAGNAAWRAACPPHSPVHPRVCGERVWLPVSAPTLTGSSPRVRGTRQRLVLPLQERRFIPACAGNADSVRSSAPPRSVHPRVCGERGTAQITGRSGGGSSPRVRGTRGNGHRHVVAVRFIPACAGNAYHGHKHIAAGGGSSPRVRGTPRHQPVQGNNRRFIPACAGNALLITH